jgi:ABC-2 type transport system permease protein
MLYNPQMKSAYNFVPGVMGLILMLICAMMTSISIVREKETGTMEVLLVSPVNPLFIILSKAVPYFVLSLLNLTTILLLSVFVLDVPIAGSLPALLVSAMESENPAVNITAAASPIAFPTASSVAVAIPGST